MNRNYNIDYVKIPLTLDSNYIKFQRETITKQRRKIRIMTIIILLSTVLLYFVGYSYNKLVAENELLSKELIEVKEELKDKEQQITGLNIEINEMINKYDEAVINAVRKLTGTTLDKTINVVYLEAGNQGKEGMQLVADVIFNRQESNEFAADTIAEVIKYPTQFSALNYLNRITNEVKNSDNYKMAQEVVYNKLLYNTSITNEALFFVNPAVANRGSYSWMRNNKDFVLEYKNHVFYK